MKITKAFVKKLLPIIDAGLCIGLGQPKPGEMCVEAAVCYAKGVEHGDNPACVSPVVRRLVLILNDANWSSDMARAKGMRRLAIAQLGTTGQINKNIFAEMVAEISIKKTVPRALRCVAKIYPDKVHQEALEEAAVDCETKGTAHAARAAANAAYAADHAAYAAHAADHAAYAADHAAHAAAHAARAADHAAANAAYAADIELGLFAEDVVQLLIQLKAPGADWLSLTEAA